MRRTMIALGAAAALLVAPLTACSSGGGSGGSTSGGPTTVKLLFFSGAPDVMNDWQHVFSMVHAKYPKITVKVQTASWDDYWTKLPTYTTGSDVPCVVGMQMARVRQFANLLAPMGPYESKAGIKLSDFNSSILQALSVNGQQMAIPYDYGPYFVYYNKDMFKKAGLPGPTSGWTIGNFVSDAKKLTAGSRYGFILDNAIDAMDEWAPTVGGTQPATKDGNLALTSAGMKKTLAWYAGLHLKEKVSPPLSSDATSGSRAQFMAGNSAMYVSGPWDMVLAKQVKFGLGIVPMPAGQAGGGTTVGGSGFGITQKCADKDAAAKAVSVITGPDALAFLGKRARAFPARTAQAGSWYSSAVPGAQATLEAALKNAQPYYSTKNWTQVGVSWTDGVVSVINGQSSVDKFLSSIQASFGS